MHKYLNKLLNAVQLSKKLLNAVQLPKQTTERCTITKTNHWTLYNYLIILLNAVQLPKQTTERCTIT